MCSPSCSGTLSVDQGDLKLIESASVSQVLGLKACATFMWLEDYSLVAEAAVFHWFYKHCASTLYVICMRILMDDIMVARQKLQGK